MAPTWDVVVREAYGEDVSTAIKVVDGTRLDEECILQVSWTRREQPRNELGLEPGKKVSLSIGKTRVDIGPALAAEDEELRAQPAEVEGRQSATLDYGTGRIDVITNVTDSDATVTLVGRKNGEAEDRGADFEVYRTPPPSNMTISLVTAVGEERADES